MDNPDEKIDMIEPTADELADSLDAIKLSIAQATSGITRDIDEVFDELDRRYGNCSS
jgi:hypothetical protein